MEAVRYAWIDLELGRLLRLRQRGLQRLDLSHGNAGISLAVEAQHRRLHLRGKLGRAFRPKRIRRIDRRAIKRDARLECARVGGIFPDRPPAAAESDDAEPAGVAALRFGPGN